MKEFIPYEKLSKKQQRELAKARRNTWGHLSPVTRKPPNPKAYNRKRIPKGDSSSWNPFFIRTAGRLPA